MKIISFAASLLYATSFAENVLNGDKTDDGKLTF